MEPRKKTIEITRERAIEITMCHNCVSRKVAERYTDTELKEVLRHMGGYAFTFKPKF